MKGTHYTPKEDRILTELYRRGNTDIQISSAMAAMSITRSVGSISNRRITLDLIEQDFGAPKEYRKIGDLRFKQAMLAARKTGTGAETNPLLGVVKDRRPFALNTIRPEANQSLCGSAAAMCEGNA